MSLPSIAAMLGSDIILPWAHPEVLAQIHGVQRRAMKGRVYAL